MCANSSALLAGAVVSHSHMQLARLALCVLTVAASGDAQAARGDHKKSLEAAARRYFDVWNAHDVTALRALLAPWQCCAVTTDDPEVGRPVDTATKRRDVMS